MKTQLSRRSFLQTVGASGALVPLLNMRSASAQVLPKRVLFVTWTNGFWREEFWPEGEGSDYKLKKILSPLEPYKKHLLLVGGTTLHNFLDTPGTAIGAGHSGRIGVLTGHKLKTYNDYNAQSGGDSLDLYIADRLKTNTPIKNLVVGAQTGSGSQETLSFRASAAGGVTAENNPQRLFTTLFEGRSLDKGAINKLLLKRQSVLDHLGGDLDRFAKNVGSDDRAKIQAHAESVRTLEKQIQALADGPACTAPKAPGGMDLGAASSFPGILRAQSDLILAAFRCNLTQVATFSMQGAGGDIVFSWLGNEFAGAGDEYPTRTHHDIAHNRKKSEAHRDRYIRCSQWFVEQLAYLVKGLESTPEGSGTMLDNTAIVCGYSMHQNHTVCGVPWIILGSCGGYFKTNRFVKLGHWKGAVVTDPGPKLQDLGGFWVKGSEDKSLPPHNGVLIAVANAMGVPTETFGPPEYGTEFKELSTI